LLLLAMNTKKNRDIMDDETVIYDKKMIALDE